MTSNFHVKVPKNNPKQNSECCQIVGGWGGVGGKYVCTKKRGEGSRLAPSVLDRLQPHSCGCGSRRGDYRASVMWPRDPHDEVKPLCVCVCPLTFLQLFKNAQK